MTRRIKPGLVALAKQLGAMRGDEKPDWYPVVEHLAGIACPELLEGPANSGPGAKRQNWFWLFLEVERVRQLKKCDVKPACEELAKGYLYLPDVVLGYPIVADGRIEMVRADRVLRKKMKWQTIQARYYEFRRETIGRRKRK